MLIRKSMDVVHSYQLYLLLNYLIGYYTAYPPRFWLGVERVHEDEPLAVGFAHGLDQHLGHIGVAAVD